MIDEPTWWRAYCDNCGDEFHVDEDPVAWEILAGWMAEEGWDTAGAPDKVYCPKHARSKS